jgi:general secretion pathway protein D
MLAGLTRQDDSRSASGAPGLSRIPVLGGLFGRQAAGDSRDELVMLITATVASDATEVRALTDDYVKRFRALQPIR